jgi:carboxymethylenebutenolidase
MTGVLHMTDDIRQKAIDLYDRFTHEGMERRDLLAGMVRLTGSVAAANLLIGSIAACAKAAPVVEEKDSTLDTGTTSLLGNNERPLYNAYFAQPKQRAAAIPTVLVIHENRGLNDHIRDVARRVAKAGYYALAPDMLSPSGGTPANEDQARDAIGKLDLAASTSDAVAMLDLLHRREDGNGKVGAVGFCWGGAFVNRLAVAAGDKLSAGVAYYGPAPNPSEAPQVQAPLLLHYAGLDDRVNATGKPWVEALKAAGKTVEAYTYDGVNHAFNNDTSAERYNKAAADLAWQRTIAFFAKYLR